MLANGGMQGNPRNTKKSTWPHSKTLKIWRVKEEFLTMGEYEKVARREGKPQRRWAGFSA